MASFEFAPNQKTNHSSKGKGLPLSLPLQDRTLVLSFIFLTHCLFLECFSRFSISIFDGVLVFLNAVHLSNSPFRPKKLKIVLEVDYFILMTDYWLLTLMIALFRIEFLHFIHSESWIHIIISFLICNNES